MPDKASKKLDRVTIDEWITRGSCREIYGYEWNNCLFFNWYWPIEEDEILRLREALDKAEAWFKNKEAHDAG